MAQDYPSFDEPDYDAVFEGVEFVENPEPRCPCVLLLDTSFSMKGAPIKALNEGIHHLKRDILRDPLASKRVELSVVSFGPVQVQTDFLTPDAFDPPKLKASGETPMGEAIEVAIQLLEERKQMYKAAGVQYYRPWMFMITDGGPSDDWENAAELIRSGEEEGSLAFYAIGVQGANMDALSLLSLRDPLRLDGLRFRDLFIWLSQSLQAVSRSHYSEDFELPSVEEWALV